ncbi:MAG: TIGR00282 family metallophosphoesterase [Thermicanus sp.]|nr:TIGR00282 family metallophosphoesterase [Thermicanus sp.]
MRILFIGDVVGRPGRQMMDKWLPQLKQEYRPDLTVVNGENSAHGKGMSRSVARFFFELGIDVITMGNHTWDNKEIFDLLADEPRIIRPANYPEGTPGRGWTWAKAGEWEVGVINLMGRTFLPPTDCPFRKADEWLEEAKEHTPILLVDFHAEATAEKVAMGWYLDGRVSAVLGTHTHIQTADERILPKGTAYLTDVGMVGPSDGILGMAKEGIITRFLTQLPTRFEVEESPRRELGAVLVEISPKTGEATDIKRIRIIDDGKK